MLKAHFGRRQDAAILALLKFLSYENISVVSIDRIWHYTPFVIEPFNYLHSQLPRRDPYAETSQTVENLAPVFVTKTTENTPGLPAKSSEER